MSENYNSGLEFENQIAAKFQEFGWVTKITSYSGDHGADIIATCINKKLVVQCKDWAAPVGFDAIKEIHTARSIYDADFAAVVSKNGFTTQAISAAQKLNIVLLTPTELKLGFHFDRSQEGSYYNGFLKHIKSWEENQKKIEIQHNQKLKMWEAYDREMESYNNKLNEFNSKLIDDQQYSQQYIRYGTIILLFLCYLTVSFALINKSFELLVFLILLLPFLFVIRKEKQKNYILEFSVKPPKPPSGERPNGVYKIDEKNRPKFSEDEMNKVLKLLNQNKKFQKN